MNEIQTTEIKQIELEINFYKEQTAKNIIEIGKRLIQAKKMLPHGEWGKWLEEKVEFTQQTANKFMRVASEMGEYASMRNLGTAKLFSLLSLPSSDREEFIESNPVEDMTTRELQKAIKEKKELEEKIEGLQKHNEYISENNLRLNLEKDKWKKQQPEVIEKIKEVEKIIKVAPDDYEEMKAKLKNTVDKDNFNRLRKEFEEKINENHELKQQIKQLAKTDSKEQHREKLKDNTLIFCNRIHTFLNDVGGLAWLTEYIEELEDYDKRSYYKALDLLEGWIMTVKSNINREEF